MLIVNRHPSNDSPQKNRQNSLEDERAKRFSRIGAAQIFPEFQHNTNQIFSNIINNQNLNHIGILKTSSINELRWNKQATETRGFPTRHAEDQNRDSGLKWQPSIRVAMQTRPKQLQYNLAERMRSRKLKTMSYDNYSDEEKDNGATYRSNRVLRKKKVILEDDSINSSKDGNDSDFERELRSRKAMTNATRNNTISSTTHYLTAATGNRNTVVKSSNDRISSRGSEES